ncbi:D-glycero-alpha-D-manno-heptose-1,7-bisphosphate 7-phosphatase [Chitinophaga pinensis]|uniref:D,D-heptose 1,7-bisphosphate phosphatase n=1 Tax=Chitinophaga pinensis (strain ATCC 43595 / DSM 2588 / LMG 13176 / NBRC 15968 / NCIMB 11800 / UQM 2034) TaxID=485918 RepID=A0A979G4K1_CHIPD|nr:HAD-IIIA family hydrolase [Chitinophaga pinensis]ACU60580.1 histidinol-phosphate phosphatase family protein [Chitinophaga pinensis DSM 2588]
MQIDASWTLFLDRDGVINNEIKDGYVLSWDMFHFEEGVLPALNHLAKKFSRIVLVTNQRCIGRGLLTAEGLQEIHTRMLEAISAKGGRIDRIYYCPDIDSNSPCRKPNDGMALQAKADFPEIDFSKAIMVGNTLSDMKFGKDQGMTTVFIPSTKPDLPFPHPQMDYRCKGLLEFSELIQ